jgi:hypothetical protein
MNSPKEIDDNLNKKLLDDKEPVSETFCCAYFFQCLSSCCFLLYA